MDFHFGRRLLVLGFAVALVAGLVTAASAIQIEDYPEIRLIYNEEQPGHPGNSWLGRELISIGDTIEVRVTATPPESVDYVIADLCAFGGGTHDTLHHFEGQDAWISGMAWIPSCSDGSGFATMNGLTLWGLRNPSILDETWQVWYDEGTGNWDVEGNLSGVLTLPAATGALYYGISGGDTLFTFTISGVSGVCCTTPMTDCDHFEFETHAPVQADSTFVKRFMVEDGGECWIDHNPCWYEGHWDATVQVIACDTSVAFCDTARTMWPGMVWAGEPSGDSLWVDTHWTTYAQLEDPAGYGAEFIESNDYTFEFDFDNSGLGPIFGLPDEILNPTSPCAGLNPDQVCALIDMRKLSHENGNDDIDSLYFDLSSIGDAWADPLAVPTGDVNDGGFWFIENANYGDIDCDMTGPLTWGGDPYNGWSGEGVFSLCWNVLPGQTDEVADVEYIMMWWISDSGDTTFFPVPTHKLAAIDNIIPGMTDTTLAEPRDTVDVDDVTFDADMTLAGHSNVLNPVSEGNPTPDWLQAMIDLEGLFDLDDVTDGGQGWVSMTGIGVYNYDTDLPPPFGWGGVVPMGPMSPTWGSEEIDVIASPPSPYDWDQDSVLVQIWIFDNAGNVFCVGPATANYAIDNILPLLSESECLAGPYIYAEIENDVAFKRGIANVGAPLDMECGGLYNNRDEIVLHADLGDALGIDEVGDVEYVTDAEDPFCVGGIRLFDDGTHGSDPVTNDKNFTGHARIEVGGSTRNDTTFCVVDTDEDSLGFDVLVTDDAGNAAINSACRGIRVDNEIQTMSPEHVSMYFYDDPETIELDGDKNGDGIVNTGDLLIFEWRVEDEPWEDGEISNVGIVWVDLASIDPSWSGHVDLDRIPSGGVWRNYYPDEPGPFGDLFEVPSGSVDGAPLQANFTNWDNAGNTPGWCLFTSDLILDDLGPSLDCDSIAIAVSGTDEIASIGDTLYFSYDGPDEDVVAIGIWVGSITSQMDTLWLVQGEGVWTGSVLVTEGTLDTDNLFVDVWAFDDVGNSWYGKGCAGPIVIDNEPPAMTCTNAWLRLWDYNDNVTSPSRVVNVGDNLTAIYWDEDGDVVRATADFSNYYDTEMVYEMVSEFAFGPPEKWGYRVDPVPDGNIDQPAGGIKTKVKITAYDDAGNMTEAWFCPMWYSESLVNGGDNWLYNHGGLCSNCLPVDTERPEPVPPDAITFELLETSNGIANVGDRLRIIVDMGDPTAPGYDMEWDNAFVQADISQYGDDYACADMDDCRYLFLTDDGYSAGGEGDGRFSYFFWYDADDGPTLFEGAPILPGETDLPASDEGTKIRVRAMDDAGNWSLDWTWSDVLVSADTGYPVPVDNYIPEIDPEDVSVTFVDNDGNGICNIGDDVTITVDMTDAPGGAIAGVYANLYDWGHPSQDMVPLIPGSPIYSITFRAQRNPGDFCPDQPDGGVGFEDLADDINCGEKGLMGPGAEVELVAKDVSDNWSAYEWVGAPGDSIPETLAMPSGGHPDYEPMIAHWPFVWDWSSSGWLTDILVDTDAPDPVNPTFPYPHPHASEVEAVALQDGRIGLQLHYRTSPRNLDVKEFYVYGDLEVPGTINWDLFLGEPIPAASVPNYGLSGNYEWISDVLPERADDPETPLDESFYHFGVIAVDNANNQSDPALTWVTGMSSDATAPTAYLDAVFQYSDGCGIEGQPTTIGRDNVDLLGYLDEASEYINVVYVELYGRVKDLDPSTEGDQPGLWTFLDEHGHYPSGSTIDAPYMFESDAISEAFEITHCETFELVLVPWDEAGNHLTPDECQIFTFTYDPFDPVITMFAINGNPSPEDMELANSALIEVTATDECTVTGELTYWLYLEKMGRHDMDTEPLLSRQTLPIGTPFVYNWDLLNYPQGKAEVELYVCDDAGNYTHYSQDVTVIDQSVPSGVFASYKLMGSHPYYTRLLDGHEIPGGEFTQTWFWTEWPDPIPFWAYDVTQVKMEWRLAGSLDGWTTIGIQTSYNDTETWDGSVWAGYGFIWDTRIFNEGDQVELQATVMDDVGNTHSQSITVTVAAEAPILALTIPEAQDVCSENRIKGPFNLIGTEVNGAIDTYYASYIIKRHDYPDLGDCDPFDTDGWIASGDSMMLETGTTNETIWRVTIDPATAFMGFHRGTPTFGMADGIYDIALVTIDVAGNWSWDTNDDMCVDAGYFEWAVANGMGMTVVLQNEAPEVRIRTVNDFGPVDEPWPWPQPVYVQADDAVTVTSWTGSTCDVAKVEYYLADTDTSNDVVLDGMRLVAVSTSPDYYQATFPPSGGVGQYLVPGALQHGYVVVELIAKLTDVLGNESFFYADMWILDISPASAMITSPAPASYIRHTVALEADALADDEIYSVTYQYRPVGTTTWITIATTRPHDGDPWNTDTNNNTIYWNTDLVADGAYEMRAVSKDADLMDDANPPVIRVFVDNTVPVVSAFTQTPNYLTGSAVPPAPTTWIGGPKVELAATATDAGGLRCVRFWYKPVEDHVDDATLLFEDGQAPYAYTWEGSSFTCLKSGWYNLIVEAEDLAGNVTYYGVTVYVDQWAPDGWITQINTDQTPGGSDFWGVLTITGLCKDDVPMDQVQNQKYDSGLMGAQFQYRPYVADGGSLLGSEPYASWVDLGGVITGSGPTYTINWDTGTLVPGQYELRIVGIDHLNNRADVDGTPQLASTMIYIVDTSVPKAIIAGVDKVSGTIWATTDTHGQDDIAFVRFEYKPASALETAEWTVIGEVDCHESYSGLYGTLWHFATLANGNYWVHAVAYDNDYDVVRFPNLFDQNPAMMMVTIANGEVTMAPTSYITELDRWGNLEDYEGVMVKAVCAAGQPTVIVVKDDDPEDHFNIPRAWKLDLERPDDQSIWVDGFSAAYLGDWGIATIIGTYNNLGTVGAKTSTVKVFKVTDVEGTKGVVSQDGMSINIPPGAIYESSEGLMMIKVQTPVAKPTIDPIVPVGQTVFFEFLDDQPYWSEWYEFVSGMWATVTLPFDPSLIPAGYSEANLRVAVWHEDAREWKYFGISNITVDQVNNKVTFLTTHTGAYAVVAGSTLRITEPVYVPGCGDYTGTWPAMYTTIEDLLYGIRDYEIKVILDGPAGHKVFDNMVLYYHEEPMEGVQATYDEVSHNLYLAFDPTWDWEEYYYQRLGKLYDGLPAGTYTVTIKALNLIGDLKTLTDTFIVDAAKPTVNFVGQYVAANPSFTLNVDDAHSGVDFETVFLDVFAIQPSERYYGTEEKEYLGTATPSAMTYNDETGQVTFGQMIYGQTLADGMSIDVIVYDGHVPFDYYSEGWYDGQVLYDGCDDFDDHQCRRYYSEQGIADCVGNHANPVWRRFTVDAMPPVMAVLSDDNDQMVEIRVEDANCGIGDFEVWVDGYLWNDEYEGGYTFTPTSNNNVGILRIDVGPGAHTIKVKAYDCVDNFSVIEIDKGAEVVGVSDVMSYPNPFDPWKGEYATISFDLSKTATVMVKIFDFAGEPVVTLADQSYGSGTHTVNWFGTDGVGKVVGTGAYIGYIKIDDGQKVITKNVKIGVANGSND